jgi:hypothetical protein
VEWIWGVILMTKPIILTDEEIEAIEWCVEMMKLHATECDDELATLRNLLKRTKDK